MKKKAHTDPTNRSIEQDHAEREEALKLITELEEAQIRVLKSLNERRANLQEDLEAHKRSSNLAPKQELSGTPHQAPAQRPVSRGGGEGFSSSEQKAATSEKQEFPTKNSKKDKLLRLVFLISVIAFLASSASYTLGFLTTNDGSSTMESNIAFSQDLGVYTDSQCTQNLTCIDWGTLLPGENVSYLLYVCNLGNTSFTLQLQTVDWTPISLSADVLLTWDYGGQVVKPTDVVPIILSLSVSPYIEHINAFTHNIVIIAHPLASP